MLRLLGLAGLAALAFLATTTAIRPLVPLPEDSDLRVRMAQLGSAAPPYDLVILGPSTARCAFDPRIIDAELAGLGHPTHTLNLALPGASSFEIDHLVDEIVALRPPGLRWVVIELQPPGWNSLIRPKNVFTDRAVYWHSPRQVGDLLTGLGDARDGQQMRLDRAATHVRHGLWRLASVGQADHIAANLIAPAGATGEPDPRRGYGPEDCGTPPRAQPAREHYERHPEEYRQRARRLDRENAARVDVQHLNPAKLERQIEHLRAIGAEPVYVLTPILSPVPAIHSLRERGTLPTLLDFDSPIRHPDFYEPRHRWDRLHLNEDGAARFSRQFARRFARWLDSGREH